MTALTVLTRETAHLSPTDRDQIADMLRQALALASPTATPQALSDKLLTLFDAPRWVRVLVAKAALDLSPLSLAA